MAVRIKTNQLGMFSPCQMKVATAVAVRKLTCPISNALIHCHLKVVIKEVVVTVAKGAVTVVEGMAAVVDIKVVAADINKEVSSVCYFWNVVDDIGSFFKVMGAATERWFTRASRPSQCLEGRELTFCVFIHPTPFSSLPS